MKAQSLLVTTLLISTAAGCSSKQLSIKSQRLGAFETPPKNAMTYSLPRRMFSVTIPYVQKKYTKYTNGIPEDAPQVEIECNKPITLTPVLVPDPNQRFAFHVDPVSESAWFESNFSVSTSETGILLGLNAEATDKTIETIQGVFSAALSIAKTFAPAGAETQPISDRANKLIEQIAATSDPAERKKLQEELQQLYVAIAEIVRNNRTEVTETEGTFSTIVDVESCPHENGQYICPLLPKFSGYRSVPRITMRVSGVIPAKKTEQAGEHTETKDPAAPDGPESIPNNSTNFESGVAVRRPVVGVVEVVLAQGTAELTVLKTTAEFPQFGEVQFVQVPIKRLTSRKVALEFGTTSGAVTKYSLESGSSADKVANALKASAAELQTAVSEIRKAEAEAEKARREAAQAQIDVLLKRLDEMTGAFNKFKAIEDAAHALRGTSNPGAGG